MDWFEQGKIKEIPLFDALKAKRGGTIKLPLYQRDAIWSEGRICALWDSLLRGFPLPSFLLAKGKGNSRVFDALRPRGLVADQEGEYYDLLDGQQRMAAIDAISWQCENPIRLWLDLAPGKEVHPLKFKYWIQACTKVFPFGFRMEASGEHDLAVLHDSEISHIWGRLQDHAELKGKEFYELPLSETSPFKAGCPVPLDDLMNLIHPTQRKRDELSNAIFDLSKTWKETDLFRKERQEPDVKMAERVAEGLLRLCEYKLAFQLLEWDAVDDEDDYTLFERIGRGGVQITQRQLAVSKLMLELGGAGNNAVAAFQSSEKLRDLLETEDVIHALARVAFAVTTPKTASEHETDSEHETEDVRNSRDLLDLTPQRLKAIQKDHGRWSEFIAALKEYCSPVSEVNRASQLQQAFERLYESLRYGEGNPHGFSLAQLAQPNNPREREGIAPITLHALLYWHLVCSDGKITDEQRSDMLRWVLFANGFVSQPQHPKLNREVFQCVVGSERIDFTQIKQLIFKDVTLCRDLGFIWQFPIVENGGIVHQELGCSGIPAPDIITNRTARRLVLQNSASPGINWFILMWNQREAMESLYGKIDYRPALFSKGRPFDADHIVARSRFLHSSSLGINDEAVRSGVKAIILNRYFSPIIEMQNDIIGKQDNIKLLEWCFRKNLPSSVANYRYWPKRLNRRDQNKTVAKKMCAEWVKEGIMCDPLKPAFAAMDKDEALLWQWSVIPKEDESLWKQFPPEGQWNEKHIGEFILATLKREYFLYNNAYRFLEG